MILTCMQSRAKGVHENFGIFNEKEKKHFGRFFVEIYQNLNDGAAFENFFEISIILYTSKHTSARGGVNLHVALSTSMYGNARQCRRQDFGFGEGAHWTKITVKQGHVLRKHSSVCNRWATDVLIALSGEEQCPYGAWSCEKGAVNRKKNVNIPIKTALKCERFIVRQRHRFCFLKIIGFVQYLIQMSN